MLDYANLVGSNTSRIKTHNMRAVLLNLLANEPAYRVQIAKQTSLSTTTITNLIDELIEAGLVAEDGVEEVDGPRRVGRPSAALRLIKDARYAIGVQTGVETYRIALVNLKAEVVAQHSYTFSRATPPDAIFQQIAHNIQEIIQENAIPLARILGVGVGAAGLVNYQTGVNNFSANLGWENVPIRHWLSEQTHLPVVVDNNVKAMALGEAFFGAGRNIPSLVFVYGRVGVGSGIVINNRLLRGADLGAGEIGHMIIIADGGKPCRCGQSGCLETLISEPALIRQAEELSQQHPGSLLARNLQNKDGRPIDHILAAARAGDPHAKEMFERASRYLGIALANLVNLLNPTMIVLGGLYYQGRDLFLPTTRQTLENSAFAGLGKRVKLQSTEFGWQAGMVGAATLALTNLFYLNPEEI
jgi:glucokinase-like ROK family protein